MSRFRLSDLPSFGASINPRRRITARPVAFVLAFSVALWTIYRINLEEHEAEHAFFWPPETPEI